MKAIYLNHIQTKTSRTASWALLLLGLMALFSVLFAMQHFKQRNTELQEELGALQVKNRPQRTVVMLPDARSEAVKTAITNIVTPWASLLKALEEANHDGVQMLAFEPNAKMRTVKLNLIALDQASMWAYLESLKMQAILHEVRLVSNEIVQINGAQAQSFWLEAKW